MPKKLMSAEEADYRNKQEAEDEIESKELDAALSREMINLPPRPKCLERVKPTLKD